MAKEIKSVPYIKLGKFWYPFLRAYREFGEEEMQRRFFVNDSKAVAVSILEGERKSYKMVTEGKYGFIFKIFPLNRNLSEVASSIVAILDKLSYQGVYALLSFVKTNYKVGSAFTTPTLLKEEGIAQEFANAYNKCVGNDDACVIFCDNEKSIARGSLTSTPTEVKKEPISRNDKHFYVEPEVNKTLTLANLLANKTGFANVLLIGPSGFGKTTLAYLLAEKTKREFVKVDMSLVTEASEILGSLALVNGSTVFNETPFTQAIKNGNCVILLDELNRAYPNVTNPLLGLLDETHSVTYAGVTYNVAPNTVFVVTANIGSQYTGTFKSDAALLNRMNFTCEVGNLPPEEEVKIYTKKTGVTFEQAKLIVKALIDCRATFDGQIDFSPRTGISIARIVEFGGSLRFAFIKAIGVLEPEEKKSVLDVLSKLGEFDNKFSFTLLF